MLRQRLAAVVAGNSLLVALTLLLAAFLLVVGRALLGVDSWMTLVAGREIVESGLPHRETLTTIAYGREWVDQQWLAQVAFYGAQRLGGLGLALVVHAFAISAAIAIAMTGARLRGASARMTLLAAIVCLVVAPWSWQLRAQSLALPLFALTLALVAADQRLERRRTWLALPVLVAWANVHGSVVLGALVVMLAAALELLRRRAWRLAVFLAAPWLCVLASPYGTALVHYYRLLLLDSAVAQEVSEWRSPPLHGYFVVFFAVAAATVALVVWQRRRLSLFDILVLALTLAGGLRSVRAVVWFTLALAVLVPLALDGLARSQGAAPVHRRVAVAVNGSLAVVVAALAVSTLLRGDAWFERDWSSVGAAAAATAAGSVERPGAIWPSDTYSDWLLWKHPTLRGRVAWDVRFELLSGAELRRIVRFNDRAPGWQAAPAGFPLLVLDRDRNPGQIRALRREQGMGVVYADAKVVVLRPRDAEQPSP